MAQRPQLDPQTLAALRPVIADAVQAALSAFFLGQQARKVLVGVSDDASLDVAGEWRKAASLRYGERSWKRSLTDVIPFRQFRPSEIVREYGQQLKAQHPTHNHIESAVANVISWLVRDGILVKIETGLYAPAIDGSPIV